MERRKRKGRRIELGGRIKASSTSSPDKDSMRITLPVGFRLITELNTLPFLQSPRLMFSTPQIYCPVRRSQSDTPGRGRKGQSLQDVCRLFVWKFFF
ncbi:hypothetical protein TNCV_32921 [Trichonephila clavipes]|nr:hypothetical protein TNCV_32921 [Trichonephila clavipes]